MAITITPVFNRQGLKTKSGVYSVHFRLSAGRQSDYLKIDDLPKLKEKDWSGTPDKWVKSSHHLASNLNAIIRIQKERLEDFVLRNRLLARPVSLNEIKVFYKGHSVLDQSFNQYIEQYIKEHKELEYTTRQSYRSFLGQLNKFNPNLLFHEINPELVEHFRDYLMHTAGIKGTTTKKYFDKFKKVYRDAAKKKLLEYDPFLFDDLKIKKERVERVALSQEEVKILRDLKFPKALEHLAPHRDVFLFQCITGLYYSTLKLLDSSNIVTTNNGGRVIQDTRKKTNELFIIPLNPLALQLLGKHMDPDRETLFPELISDQKYNDKLKLLASAAGITKPLTNKVGRHTFTDLMISLGNPRSMVAKMLGHSKEETTNHYFDLNADHIYQTLKPIEI